MNVSIISDNCWGTGVYRYLNMEYTSPFVNLFIHTPSYLKMLKNLFYYLDQKLSFIDGGDSITNQQYGHFHNDHNRYPVGVLEDIEIHFVHFDSKKDVENKWYRRLERLYNNRNNLLVKMGGIYFGTEDRGLLRLDYMEHEQENIIDFHSLPFKNKISFSEKEYNIKNNYKISDHHDKNDAMTLGMLFMEYSPDLINNLK